MSVRVPHTPDCWQILDTYSISGIGHSLCLHECGYEQVIPNGSFKQGRNPNCNGCYGKRSQIDDLLSAASAVRSQCLKRQPGDLTIEQVYSLIIQPCFYCENPGSNIAQRWSTVYYNGIDRVDSSIGYYIDNCVPCCKWCNAGKSTQSAEDYIQRCKAVAANFS